MALAWLRPLLLRSRHWLAKNAPHILMGMGTTGSVTAVIFAVKATPAAIQAKKDAEFIKSGGEPAEGQVTGIFQSDMEKLTPMETVRACGKFYIPAVGLEIFSLACFWGAHGINLRRQAVLAGLYSAAEQTLIEYQKKVIEMVGKDQEAEIRNAISGDHSNNAPPITYIVDKEDPDCWFLYSGQWFRNSYSNIKDIQNDANSNMLHNLYISEAELIWLFDPDGRWIKPTPDSHHIGWNCDRLIEFDIVPTSTRKHEPAFEIIIRDKFGNRYLPQPGFSRSL